MKKGIVLLGIVFLFVLGAGAALYPSIANYVNKKNEAVIIKNMVDSNVKMDVNKIEKEKEAVRIYNKSLLNCKIVLTDPFDPDSFPVTDGVYEELLSDDEIMASIEIPKIDVILPIYHGTSTKTLEKGVGHLENTSLPMGGKSTHTVLSAHTGLPSNKLFSDIDKLNKGDIFYIRVLNDRLSYSVDQIKIVSPENSDDLIIADGKDYVTLITCTPYGKNTKRLLVRGKRIENIKAQKTITVQKNKQSFIDKILMKYGLTFRELTVMTAIPIMTVIFILILIFKRGEKAQQ